MNNEFCFIHEEHFNTAPLLKPDIRGIDLFFGPLEEDFVSVKFSDEWKMCHLMVEAGIFPSITQAKKNGWDSPIPEGWTELTVTKKKIKLFIMGRDKVSG